MPVVVLVGQPASAEAMGVGQFNKVTAGVTSFIQVSVSVSSLVGLLTASTFVPVVVVIGDPVGAEAVLVNNISVTSVALFVHVGIDVSSDIGGLAAFAGVPVVGSIGDPLGAEAMLVGGQGNVGVTDVALAVDISVSVSSLVGLLAAFADVPVVGRIGLPLSAVAVSVSRSRRCGGGGVSRLFAAGTQHCGHRGQHCQSGDNRYKFLHSGGFLSLCFGMTILYMICSQMSMLTIR